jgi:hypothetical protein
VRARGDQATPRRRHGLRALRAAVKVAGLAAIDARTSAAKALLAWRQELIADLGGEDTVSAQQVALVEVATRTKLYVDHLDAFLMSQHSLVNARRKAVLPVLMERQQLADSLTRILTTLGLERRKQPGPTLDDWVASLPAKRNASPPVTGTGPSSHEEPADDDCIVPPPTTPA